MRVSTPLGLAGVCLFLAACAGGGAVSSAPPVRATAPAEPPPEVSSGAVPAPVVESPTAVPSANPTPAPGAAEPASGTAPLATATPVRVVNSTSSPRTLADYPGVVIGVAPYGVATSAPARTSIDGLPCTYGMAYAQHFHAHFSFYVNGRQYAVPAAVGIYHPKVVKTPYYYDANGSTYGCDYDIHTHAPDGVIHIETGSSTLTFSLKELLDIWHVTLTSNNFWNYNGPTRVFLTDEATGGPGTHPVREITGMNWSTIQLKRHLEITVEVGPAYVNTPNYTFYGSL